MVQQEVQQQGVQQGVQQEQAAEEITRWKAGENWWTLPSCRALGLLMVFIFIPRLLRSECNAAVVNTAVSLSIRLAPYTVKTNGQRVRQNSIIARILA